VATLETPAVALAEGVLLAPVVGHLDSRRAERLTERLLREVGESRARLVVLDIAGVPAVDSAVAGALLRAVQAVRLLGCDVTITGISASIATTMTQLGISMAGVRTARTPQEALKQAVVAGPGGVHNNN
jgi:anti-anti-sigma factor